MSGITISRRRWSSRRRTSASRWTPTSRPTTGAPSSASYKKIVEKRTGKPFPQEPREQLWGAIGAVFGSWMNQRAITYRRLHAIPESWGTAVNVQAMVFGNMGEDCATGVAFTRDPSTGANLFYGEYLVNAQGEDVVAGIRTPQHLTVQGKEAQKSDAPAMEEVMPEVFKQLDGVRAQLETHYRDMQDIEFTVQRGKLYMLQTRNGKRTAKAALKIAVDMVREGLIDKKEAVARIVPASLDQLLHPTLDPKAERKVIAKGLPASPGAASGKVVFTADEAEKQARAGEKVILVRRETSPEDIHGMHAAEGILTSTGGMTSHAAVVARGMGKPCVAGAGDVRIDGKAGTLSVRGTVVKAGDFITLDGSTGEIMLGVVPTVQPELSGDFAELMAWADEFRTLGIRANAETPLDAGQARKFGAEGIGLCRTEHMFFEGDRIVAVRQMILADDEKSRRAALAKIQPMQRQDFVGLFEIMAGLPVTIRLLDPPLHEFLPKTHADMEVVAKDLGVDVAEIEARAHKLHEFNPMLGHRGVRLGISYPEIYEMQARAIFEAVVEVQKKAGKTVIPEIMIPLVATRKELDLMKVGGRPGRGRGEPALGPEARLPGRHHDRAAARRPARRRHRPVGRLLQLRHQRPDADHVRPQPRRFGVVPGEVPAARHPRARSLRLARHRGRGRADRDRLRARPQGAQRPEARHLRRAWRRSGLGVLLPQGRPRLRLVLALPRADRAAGRRPGGPRRPAQDGMTLSALRDGGKRALAAALAGLERDPEGEKAQALLDAAWREPKAHVVGVTGPPGVGKSSLCAALVAAWRKAGKTVGVIAVDPSSKSSGGALLGDRVRIVHDSTDEGSFVRSMAARDRLGGLADQTLAAMVVMRALFDRVLIETVGVGQSETDVAGVADTVVFCVQPGSGDSLQFMKAGIVEIPHLIVVTKADLGARGRAGARRRGGSAVACHGGRRLAGQGAGRLVAQRRRHRRADGSAGGASRASGSRRPAGRSPAIARARAGSPNRCASVSAARALPGSAVSASISPCRPARSRSCGCASSAPSLGERNDEPSDRRQLHLLQDRRGPDPVLQAPGRRQDHRLHGHQPGEPGPFAGRRQGPLADGRHRFRPRCWAPWRRPRRRSPRR